LGPLPAHVRQLGSHAVQVAFVVAVQTALSNSPLVQVVQPSQVVAPLELWNVPAVQG
jgi:hypothetical protein